MQLQHVNVKLLLEHPADVDLEPLIPIFHNWIQGQTNGELLLDVADYRHVHEGPGVVLIGFEGDYSVDNIEGRLGVRYNRKAALDGDNQDRLKQATRAALLACRRLETDPSLDGKLRFNGQEIQMFINDRLISPNRAETRQATHDDLRLFCEELFRGKEFSISPYSDDPRKLFGISVKAAQPVFVADLLARLV